MADAWRAGEAAVLGLGRSGRAAALLLAKQGRPVYASDAGRTPAVDEAAAALAASGIDAQAGGHDLDRIARAAVVVVSPGIPPEAAPLAAARAAGVPIVSEIEVALRAMPDAAVIAITGTNGKTTTTALVAQLLQALGHDAVAAGNIGTPLATFALRERPPAWVALEISSFQLHDTPSIAPRVGVLTALAPDHLDRYPDVATYYADKARLFANATPASRWVHTLDNADVRAMVAGVPGQHATFSVSARDADAWYDRDVDELIVQHEVLLRRAELPLLGDHNVANALAAALAVTIADPAHAHPDVPARLAGGLRGFRALAHRLEPVGEAGGVLWINDSKATNLDSTRVAIAGMTRPTVLLLGGRHKGTSYATLADLLPGPVKVVLAYGEAAPLIEADLAGLVPVERGPADFASVVARARALAEPGDAVLLSPACSSYDMFEHYEARGAEFRRLALPR
jgi:UDP-N-acetylmuramoylalanine--D-glutamate ligase